MKLPILKSSANTWDEVLKKCFYKQQHEDGFYKTPQKHPGHLILQRSEHQPPFQSEHFSGGILATFVNPIRHLPKFLVKF